MAGAAPGAEDGRGPQKVLVIGAGPAGVCAATQLADRGRSVTIWERDDHVGGQIALAAAAPHRERLGDLVAYLEREIQRAGVTVEFGHNATSEEVKSFGADAVIVATGALAHVPQIAGIDQANVTDVHTVLRGEADLGDNVLVIMGRSEHRYEALTTAEYIAEQGKQVRVATDANYAGDLWEATARLAAYRRLARLGVELTPMVELVAIRENQVEMRNRYSHEPEIFEVDTIVVAHGEDANSRLLAELEQLDLPVHSVGDVVAPRALSDAFQDAAFVTAQL
jgi:pyruvate/2-oxoglutarate dehydrogenase complex dihydrolipoamide dehydrogenase (E3) component